MDVSTPREHWMCYSKAVTRCEGCGTEILAHQFTDEEFTSTAIGLPVNRRGGPCGRPVLLCVLTGLPGCILKSVSADRCPCTGLTIRAEVGVRQYRERRVLSGNNDLFQLGIYRISIIRFCIVLKSPIFLSGDLSPRSLLPE